MNISSDEYRFSFTSQSVLQTQAVGAKLARCLSAGDTVSLVGGLGSGKTVFASAVISELCGVAPEEVVSPTFVVVRTYRGNGVRVVHVDAYRLQGPEEYRDLDVGEMFADDSVVLVEWADRVAGALPQERVQVELRHVWSAGGWKGREIAVRSPRPIPTLPFD